MRHNLAIHQIAAIAVGGAWLALCAGTSHAVFFDLRGLDPSQATSYRRTLAGVSVRFGVDGGAWPAVSGPTTFGIDSNGSNDVPTLFDGGNGLAEAMVMLFDQPVFFESVLISQFGSEDSGSLDIKTLGHSIPLTNGLNPIGAVADWSSAHYLRWTGVNAPGAGRGFSVDGFTVRLIGTVPAQSGDYDNNGKVGADDFVVWRKTLGNSITSFGGADGDGDGIINTGDYNAWRENFGKGTGSGLGQAAVPEASALFLSATGTLALFASRRRPCFIRFER